MLEVLAVAGHRDRRPRLGVGPGGHRPDRAAETVLLARLVVVGPDPDREVVPLHRQPGVQASADPCGRRPHAPRAIALAGPAVRVVAAPVDLQPSGVGAGLHEMRVSDQQEPITLDLLGRHLVGLRASFEAQVERESVHARRACHPPASHRVDDLERERAGSEAPAVLPELAADAQVALLAGLPHDRESIHVSGVRVDPETGVHQHLAGAVVHLDDESLGPARVVHEHAIVRVERLVREQVVQRREHRYLQTCV